MPIKILTPPGYAKEIEKRIKDKVSCLMYYGVFIIGVMVISK
jgi:hypothetical protein